MRIHFSFFLLGLLVAISSKTQKATNYHAVNHRPVSVVFYLQPEQRAPLPSAQASRKHPLQPRAVTMPNNKRRALPPTANSGTKTSLLKP